MLPSTTRQKLLTELSESEAAALLSDWRFWARPEQLPPEGDWRIWLFLAGRGAGKTRSGAEWIAEGVRKNTMRHIGLIAASQHDSRAVIAEGESGLLNVDRSAHFEPANKRILWKNGAVARLLSADKPDSIRGFQFDAVWADEFCKWPQAQAALDMILMALRLGMAPRMLITTTPRNIPALQQLLTMQDVVISRCATTANATNLAPGFVTGLELRYGGTRLGRQELDGELISDNPDALWRRDEIERHRISKVPQLIKVVVAIDPPASITGDECGIITAGLSEDGKAYILADGSGAGLSPAAWAGRTTDLYRQYEADCIIAEANQGGEMVRSVLLQAMANAPVRLVHATRDKRTRALPAAMLYEQGKVFHAGSFPELEDQMCSYDGTGHSPDRMDALVWALAALFPARQTRPAIRRL